MGKYPNPSNLKCERKTSNKAMYTLYKQKYKINCNKTTVYQAITTPLYINLYLYTSVISITVQSRPVPIPSPINKPIAVISILQTFYLLHQMRTLSTEKKAAAQMGLLSTAGL
jgi:hypothetical protein